MTASNAGLPQGTGPADEQRYKRGVVFVHGVGAQKQSDFLLDLANPIVDWLELWYKARDKKRLPEIRRSQLDFSQSDGGRLSSPSCATLLLPNDSGPDDVWCFAEAWWAASNRRAEVHEMLPWAFTYLWQGVRHVGFLVSERWRNRKPPVDPTRTDPGRLTRWLDLGYAAVLAIVYPLAMVLGFVFLLLLMVLAKVPIPVVRDFVFDRLIRPFLEINAGEFRANLEDEIQAANIRRRVAEAIDLVRKQGCKHIVVIAHSEGVVPTHGALTDPRHVAWQRDVSKVIALGSALNLSWEVAPDLARIKKKLPAEVTWLELWGSFDPVPSGAPRPPDKIASAAPETNFLNEQVTNEMSVISDHGVYWQNDEQVVVRLVAEIDRASEKAGGHINSRFWRGNAGPGRLSLQDSSRTEAMRAAIVRRRQRVSHLALARGFLLLVWLVACVAWASPYTGWMRWPWLRWPDPFSAEVLSLIGRFYELPTYLEWPALWLAYGLVALVLFTVGFRTLYWDRKDRRERKRAIMEIALARVLTDDELESKLGEQQPSWQQAMLGWIVAVCTALTGLFFWLASQPPPSSEAPLGIISLQFAFDAAHARPIIDAWARQGLLDEARTGVWFDYAFLVSYTVALCLACLLAGNILRGWSFKGFGRWLASWGPKLVVLGAALDWIENYALLAMLGGATGGFLPRLASICAWPKFIAIALVLVPLLPILGCRFIALIWKFFKWGAGRLGGKPIAQPALP